MTFIIIILIILLLISIVNNYLMYQRKVDILNCPNKLINDLYLPDNTAYKTITFFYKKNNYNKCYKNDLKNNIESEKQNRFNGEMTLIGILDDIKAKHSNKLYFVENNSNVSRINLSDENLINIKYLPE